jgi:hypothetical protein
MSKTIRIGWTPCGNEENAIHNELTHYLPERVTINKEEHGETIYCPATREFYKNTFALRSPWNISIEFDSNGKPKFEMPEMNHPSQYFEVIMMPNGDTMIQILLNNMFISDTKGVYLENLPPGLHGCREEFKYINGVVDIYSWQRSVHVGTIIPKDYTFKCSVEGYKIDIKKGDVLQYVRFRTPNGENVKLVELTEKSLEGIRRYAMRCESSTRYLKRMNLKEIYERVSTRRPKEFIKD